MLLYFLNVCFKKLEKEPVWYPRVELLAIRSIFVLFLFYIFLHVMIYYFWVDYKAVMLRLSTDSAYPYWYSAIVEFHRGINPVMKVQELSSGYMYPYHGGIYTVWVLFFIPVSLVGFFLCDSSVVIKRVKKSFQNYTKSEKLCYGFLHLFVYHFLAAYACYHLFYMGGGELNEAGEVERFFIYESKEALLLFGAPGLFVFFIVIGGLVNFYFKFSLVLFKCFYKKL